MNRNLGLTLAIVAMAALSATLGPDMWSGNVSPTDVEATSPPAPSVRKTEVTYAAPAQPTHTTTVLSAGSSLRINGSAFAGDQDDTHTGTQVAIALAGAAVHPDSGFSANAVFVDLGAVETHTAAVDSGSNYVSTLRYEATNGGYGPWADSVTTLMEAPTGITEPTCGSVNDIILVEDDFESYADSAALNASSEWTSINDAPAKGGIFRLGSGLNGSSQSIEFVFPNDGGSPDFNLSLVDRGWNYTGEYWAIQFTWKSEVGGDVAGPDNIRKWVVLEQQGGGTSKFLDILFSTITLNCPNLWTRDSSSPRHVGFFYAWEGSSEPNASYTCGAGQAIYHQHLGQTGLAPESLNDGNEHDITILRRRESAQDAGDGGYWLWIDGTAVIAADGEDAADPGFGAMYTRFEDVGGIKFGAAPMNGGSNAHSEWYDDIVACVEGDIS